MLRAAVALCLYALMQPLVASARMRALLAFLAAQSALLYGYSLWGGIKELTAAFLLVLGVALADRVSRDRRAPERAAPTAPPRGRRRSADPDAGGRRGGLGGAGAGARRPVALVGTGAADAQGPRRASARSRGWPG